MTMLNNQRVYYITLYSSRGFLHIVFVDLNDHQPTSTVKHNATLGLNLP